jgi:hemerythrin-like domain-containing protein
MHDPVARWRDEHARFGRLLEDVEKQLDRFHLGLRPDYARILDVMRYMRDYADTFHHPREDLAFAKLAERVPLNRAFVEALLAEHAVITRSGEDLVLLLEEVLDGAFVERAEVEKPGREYVRRLRSHMAGEESLFPDVKRMLRAPDWREIERRIPERSDPSASRVTEEGQTA